MQSVMFVSAARLVVKPDLVVDGVGKAWLLQSRKAPSQSSRCRLTVLRVHAFASTGLELLNEPCPPWS